MSNDRFEALKASIAKMDYYAAVQKSLTVQVRDMMFRLALDMGCFPCIERKIMDTRAQ